MFFKATCQTNQIRIRFQSLFLLKSLRLTKPHSFCFSKTTISQQRNQGFLRISMNSLRVSGFTPGFGNNHDFSVFVNQNKIHRVLFFSTRYFADVCAAFWGKRLRCLISSLETHCWTVQQSGFRIHHRERHFPHPSNLWSEAISTLPKRCHKKIQKTDLEASWHWWYYIILHLLSLLTKLSSILRFQVFNFSSFSVIFIIIHPPSAMDGDGKWPPKSNEPKERSKRSSNAETETLESLKSLESLNLLKYFGWCLENIWELCSICSKREKTTCWNLKERCVFLFPGFFGPEIWQFNSEHMEHMALYADERWTWLSHQQIVDFDWTVNSF